MEGMLEGASQFKVNAQCVYLNHNCNHAPVEYFATKTFSNNGMKTILSPWRTRLDAEKLHSVK